MTTAATIGRGRLRVLQREFEHLANKAGCTEEGEEWEELRTLEMTISTAASLLSRGSDIGRFISAVYINCTG